MPADPPATDPPPAGAAPWGRRPSEDELAAATASWISHTPTPGPDAHDDGSRGDDGVRDGADPDSMPLPAEPDEVPPDERELPRNESTPSGSGIKPVATTHDTLLALLLPRRVLALGGTARDRLWGWLGPLLVTVLGGVLRLMHLGQPHELVFDETYYVKNAYTMAQVGITSDWPEKADPQFVTGHTDIFLHTAQYTVHPPIGKWLIALGIDVGGVDHAWAWRLATALLGTAAIFVLARTARRLFGSTTLGTVAGGLLAVDGLGIVLSRTALLDGVLMFFVLLAFGCLVVDREQTRRRLAERAAGIVEAGRPIRVLHPALGVRWWRLAAGISLGLACGTKWSGLYYVAAFGLLTVFWDLGARRRVRGRRWGVTWLLGDALPAFFAIVVTSLVVYLASWWAWFSHPAAWGRDWAASHPVGYPGWLPEWAASSWDTVRSFLAYHAQMYDFHTHLTTPHDYNSNPWLWLVQWRPTSFFWDGKATGCGSSHCVEAITSLGNPVLWWAATLAVVVLVVRLARRWDSRVAAVLAGVAAGWVPWLFFAQRTIFTFYTIVFLPFMVLAIVAVFALVFESNESRRPLARRRRATARTTLAALLAVVLLVSVFFYPIWTAMDVPHWFWQAHMWLPSWI